MKNYVLKAFDLNDQNEAGIVPVLQYDCIVNTNQLLPEQCAQQIYDCLMFPNMRAFSLPHKKLCEGCDNATYNNRYSMHAQ